jgi:peptide chain release factor 1
MYTRGPAAAAKLLKEQKELTPIIEAYRELMLRKNQQQEARDLLSAADQELRQLAQEEFDAARRE